MLRQGARCEVLRNILGHANIDVTQNIFARAGRMNEWMRDKLRIIRVAADLFHKQGARATSPDEIIEASGKGRSRQSFIDRE